MQLNQEAKAMLTLKELSEYDIKNVDWVALKDQYIKRKDVLANIAIVLVTLIVAVRVVSARNTESQKLVSEINALEAKINAAADLTAAETQLGTFYQSLPEGLAQVDRIVNEINNLAVSNGLEINAFEPSGTQEEEHYKAATLRLDITAEKYDRIVAFVQDLEKSPYNFRINKWSSVSRGFRRERRFRTDEQADKNISFTMEISSIKFKKL